MDTSSPAAQIATASEPETPVRRIATIPNGYAQLRANRIYPSQVGPLSQWLQGCRPSVLVN